MLLANHDGHLMAPPSTGLRGSCPGCGDRVDSAVGEIVTPHWRHHGQRDCDSWAGGETDWHLGWKAEAIRAGWQVEVTMRDGDVLHRADAVGPRGQIVEFQHSSLPPSDIAERSNFYAARGLLIWVFDQDGSAWRRKFYGWRDDGHDFKALLTLDTGDRLGILGDEMRWAARSALFDRSVLVAARRVQAASIPCFTCGGLPDHFFPDGSQAYACSHATGVDKSTAEAYRKRT